MIAYGSFQSNKGWSDTPTLLRTGIISRLSMICSERHDSRSPMRTCHVSQFIVRMERNPGPPSTLHQLLSKNDSAGSVAQKDGVTDFIHRESHGDTWTHSYLVGSFDIPLRTRSRA
jgi:hypothetical protein